MAKSKKSEFSPEEAVQFLEDMRHLAFDIDQKTVAISLRVPENILRALKMKAKSENRKYQSLMIEYIRQGLKKAR
jgi:predicted DNA binding CopG/RHH family protein